VLLADDHEDVLGVVSRFIQPEFEVVKTVNNGQAVLDETALLKPDLILLDISMPVLNGIEAAKRLRAAGSKVKIIFLTVHGDADYFQAALATGALGYVTKSRLASDLLPALRAASAGRAFFSPSVSAEASC
jgi:DNA-binding NarL/FixJ family response regulator